MSGKDERKKARNNWKRTPQYNFRKVTTDMEDYAQQKLKMLVMDFKLNPTEEEIVRLFSGENELQIDNYARWIFNRSTPG